MKRRVWLGKWLALAATVVVAAVIGAQPHVSAARGGGQRLTGSWIAVVTTKTPEGIPPLTILATFTEDGGIVGSAPHPHVSAAHGAWSRVGNRRFALTAVYLRFDDAGTFLGTTELRATLEVDRQATEGEATFEAQQRDSDGTVTDTFEGTAAARRIPVNPL
jgi:hypothetical protein